MFVCLCFCVCVFVCICAGEDDGPYKTMGVTGLRLGCHQGDEGLLRSRVSLFEDIPQGSRSFFFFFPLMSYVYGLCVMFCVSLFLDSSYQGFVFTLISFVYIATTTSLNPDHS